MTSPTHQKGHMLDLVITREHNNLLRGSPIVFISGVSDVNSSSSLDHYAVLCHLNVIWPKTVHKSEKFWAFQNIPVPAYRNDLILNRIAPSVDRHLIKEQSSFSPGKSCCSQLLNLTLHIEDGYQRGMITGAAWADLSGAYDTVNHILLIQKLYDFNGDSPLCKVIHNMLLRRRFMLSLTTTAADGEIRRTACQGSVLSPMLFNIYTNNQPIKEGTRTFVYADDICVTAQYPSFTEVEHSIGKALDKLTIYYRSTVWGPTRKRPKLRRST